MAELACGHGQHVRHAPPWQERSWVTTVERRSERIGASLACRLCDPDTPSPSVPLWPPGIWRQPAIVAWSLGLLDSFRRWTGRELIRCEGTPEERAGSVFFASRVVVSHGLDADPILNYGNRTALLLWETAWAEFVKTPSRMTAEAADRVERERMLARTRQHGYLEDCRGVRISSAGRRFAVEDAIVWNVIDADRRPLGQAATFSRWSYLDEAGPPSRF